MITRDEVEHIAKLARLGLTDEEVNKYQKDLSAILGYIEKHKEVDIEGVEPMSHSILLENVMRQDIANSKIKNQNEKLLKLMPELKEGYLKVKSIFNAAD
ncbi:MAG: Asp-tRNA(Asn)/Glu-tRNA(Gln) amidotransferase subunit GatC [Candidatus Wildermuthbacteria bacterium]|nr:Asp-tRNA(Asn)/Glu-tRNA(Gln) amidotransferase subunit GatC [Candidatus Wildermuthbacteria bacterium]